MVVIMKDKESSKVHLICGPVASGKTTLFRQTIQDKINANEDVCVIGSFRYNRTYFNNTQNDHLHVYSPANIPEFDNLKSPKELAEHIVNFYIQRVGRINVNTIAIDDFEQFNLNKDYLTEEYFRELSKECKRNELCLLYTTQLESDTSLCSIFNNFSDTITMLKK